MTLQQLYLALLVGGLVLMASIVATRVTSRVGLPSLLLFLAVGVAIGEDGLGLEFDDAQLARNLGTVGLAVILVEGGLTTRFTDIRKQLTPAGTLATVGVAISTLVFARPARTYCSDSTGDWRYCWEPSLSSTDAAAVFSVLRFLPLPRRVAGLLEAESGFNDAPAIILVVMFSATPFLLDPGKAVAGLIYELVAGAAIGLACGALGAIALRRIASPASGLSTARDLRAGHARLRRFRGRARERVPGRVCGGRRTRELRTDPLWATRSFAEGLGWLAQIGLFVLLGLLVDPSDLLGELIPAIVAGLVLLLIARPISVVASLAPFRVHWREQVFLVGGSARCGPDRARHHPDRRGCPRQPAPAEPRVHPGGGVHAGPRPQPALDRAPDGPDSS